jgi:nanoRNase/pAp phosphatase (c-di-AMP/oligoRNAs hydrolase)
MMQLIEQCTTMTVDAILQPGVAERVELYRAHHAEAVAQIRRCATGRSIIDRRSYTNVGELLLRNGGGGHEPAGTCQVANEDAARVLGELVAQMDADG